MKSFFSILLLLFAFTTTANAQSLHVDSTRFITGNKCCTDIYSAISTADKGILCVGDVANNPGGSIPYFPLDTVNENVMVVKIDSNHQVSWIKIYGGSSDDNASSVCQTPDGGYAVLGVTTSTNGDVTGFMAE